MIITRAVSFWRRGGGMVLYRVIITDASAAAAPVSRTAAVGVSFGGHSRRVCVRSERINERRRRRWENRSPSLPGNLVGTHTYSHKYTLIIVTRYMGVRGARGVCLRRRRCLRWWWCARVLGRAGPARRHRKIGVNYI